ncbi:MAG: hypothetical protein A2505_08640 [Deltaproteobacteria bacterium RIFOXYD12_FULL_55_16]|nr:MAG: hypothetical protein A2505_08640 [Deltaproteobacteria bacterium RIFOXYD12_FULL_55_16]
MHKKILIVDDDELVLYGLEKALQAEGVVVATAAGVSEAARKLSSCPSYDLCLLDVHLPDLHDLALMKTIRDLCPNIRIILMTASYVDDTILGEDLRETLGSGAWQFIAKPFDLHELKEIVVRALHTDDGYFHPGFRFNVEQFPERKARKNERKPFAGDIRYSMSDIENGEGGRLQLLARAIDLSEHGVGFFTEYPLRSAQVVSFEHDGLRRTGMVAWSTMIDERTCRAGVRFA